MTVRAEHRRSKYCEIRTTSSTPSSPASICAWSLAAAEIASRSTQMPATTAIFTSSSRSTCGQLEFQASAVRSPSFDELDVDEPSVAEQGRETLRSECRVMEVALVLLPAVHDLAEDPRTRLSASRYS